MIPGKFPRADLFIAVLMSTIVAMLVVPFPTWLIDIMIAMSISAAAMIFIGAFHIQSIGTFSSFPALLLLTTLFRLALSITTSRMILMEADAGRIVESFGEFVTGGDLVIGGTVFAIVTIVQFIVITKGSERVAEVCARFSLDGLPGRQMSIDADLRANTITGDQAKEQRLQLARESQIYGAMDGAIKFVKGDALAGIVIIFVNFVGGISVGVYKHGLSIEEAVQTYTLLTIGDALVAQIPALMVSVAAGFVVTRVNGDESNLATTMLSQLFGRSEVLMTGSALTLAAGFLPGFPLAVFGVLAALIFAMYVRQVGGFASAMTRLSRSVWPCMPGMQENSDSGSHAADASMPVDGLHPGSARKSGTQASSGSIANTIPETIPLVLLLPPGKAAWANANKVSELLEREAFIRLGIKTPPAIVKESATVQKDTVVVLINEVKADTVSIAFGKCLVVRGADMLESLSVPVTNVPDASGIAYWVEPKSLAAIAPELCESRSDTDELVGRFCSVVSQHISEFFGIQEVRDLLDQLQTKYPELVKETNRNAPVHRIADILQRLVSERVSVRNLKSILEALAQWAPKERDNILLVEHIRGALGRYITEKFSRSNRINVLLLSPEHEESVRQAIQQTAGGTFLNMPATAIRKLTADVSDCLETTYFPLDDIVLLCAVDIRRFVKKLVEPQLPRLNVLSYGEITDQSRINVLNTI